MDSLIIVEENSVCSVLESDGQVDPLDVTTATSPPTASPPAASPPAAALSKDDVEPVLPEEDTMEDNTTASDTDCVIVDDVPVYVSQLQDGSPFYIRQHPPTLEEMLRSPDDSSSSFDGFSEASGSTFEGFSESSCSSSVTFEGFLDANDDSIVVRDDLIESSVKESFEECLQSERLIRADSSEKHRKSLSRRGKQATKNLKKTLTSLRGRRRVGNSSTDLKKKSFNINTDSSLSITPKCRSSCEVTLPKKRLCQSESQEILVKNVKYQTKSKLDNVEISAWKTKDTVDKNVSDSHTDSVFPRKMTRSCMKMIEEEMKLPSIDQINAIDKQDFIGELCSRVGCTISFLESMKLKRVPINNGIVYELDEFAKRISWQRIDVALWLQRLSGIEDGEPTAEDLNKIHLVLKRRKALAVTFSGKKRANVRLRAFDLMEFVLPSLLKKDVNEESIFVKEEIEIEDSQPCSVSPHISPLLFEKSSSLRKHKVAEFQKCEHENAAADGIEKEKKLDLADFSLPVKEDVICFEEPVIQSNQISRSECKLVEENKCEIIPVKLEGIQSVSTETNNPVGTIGVSKSGRLRKLSARGIESIEIKSLFMPTSTPSVQPPSYSQMNLHEKRKNLESVENKNVHVNYGECQTKPSSNISAPFPKSTGELTCRKYKKFLFIDNSLISFTFTNGHLVPKFKEVDYYLGDYCCEAGVTVDDINSDGQKDVDITIGMVKELHDFYVSRGATKTSLALRLFQMSGLEIKDYTHILSAVLSVSKAAKTNSLDFSTLQKEFKFPKRFCGIQSEGYELPKKRKAAINAFLKNTKKKKHLSHKQNLKKVKNVTDKRKKGNRTYAKKIVSQAPSVDIKENTSAFGNELVKTKGKEGSITRGDIVCLYSQWLKNKMAVGSNVFVTDLLKAVEKLMTERKVQSIRIPAGTLMSSSVRLHDEYKQMLAVSKEDAVMYLEEDWLEDIQYLVSLLGPSRRSTIEGDNAENSRDKTDVSNSAQPENASVSDSEYSEKSLVIDESVISDDSFTLEKSKPDSKKHSENGQTTCKKFSKDKKLPSGISQTSQDVKDADKCTVSRLAASERTPRSGAISRPPSCYMESVGKRSGSGNLAVSEGTPGSDAISRPPSCYMESVGKRSVSRKRSIGLSLDEYESDEFSDFIEESSRKQRCKRRVELRRNILNNAQVKKRNLLCSGEDFEVEKILDFQEVHKDGGKGYRYLVKWLGFRSEDASWVDEADLQCPEVLNKYWETVRRKNPGRFSRNAKSLRASPRGTLAQTKSLGALEGDGGKTNPVLGMEGPDKENEGNIIEALVHQASLENCSNTKLLEQPEGSVTTRDVLDLYDTWRQENQNLLVAGGSNTVNLETLMSRVKNLMISRKVKKFHPESLLNACFMMTLMRTSLKSEKALNKFLESNCSEVLEASYKQYLIKQQKDNNNGEVPARKDYTNKNISLSVLQNDLKRMHQEYSAAIGLRSTNRNVLGVMEEEFNCLENILKASLDGKANVAVLLQHKLETLKRDLHSLENSEGSNSAVSNIRRSTRSKTVEDSKCSITLTETNSDKIRDSILKAGKELIKCGVPRQKLDSVIELVVNKVGGRRLRAQPAGARSISEVVGLMHK
nr:LOW QUALITY PROTEIN: uncharacterized protein LOC128704407 [Cherax quadricarinatus]